MLLDDEIKKLEQAGHQAAAFTLRSWQKVIQNPRSIHSMTTEELANKIYRMNGQEIAEYAISVIKFNWPETKEVLNS